MSRRSDLPAKPYCSLALLQSQGESSVRGVPPSLQMRFKHRVTEAPRGHEDRAASSGALLARLKGVGEDIGVVRLAVFVEASRNGLLGFLKLNISERHRFPPDADVARKF